MKSTSNGAAVVRVSAYAPRAAVRTVLRAALPRRLARVMVSRTPAAFRASFQAELVDAAIVDLDGPHDQSDQVAALARDFPTVAFIGITPFRTIDTGRVAACAELNFADVLAERFDGPLLPHVVARNAFSTRFAHTFADAPSALGLSTALQLAAWRGLVARAGRPVRTQELAAALGITREHLSRTFAAGRAPTLKRVIDLVRVLAAAELAKNPGYGVGDVARVLGYASSSHLSTTAQRVVGTKASSLASLRAVDVIRRFQA